MNRKQLNWDESATYYKDEGCPYLPISSCLNCPLPVCIEDRIKQGNSLGLIKAYQKQLKALSKQEVCAISGSK